MKIFINYLHSGCAQAASMSTGLMYLKECLGKFLIDEVVSERQLLAIRFHVVCLEASGSECLLHKVWEEFSSPSPILEIWFALFHEVFSELFATSCRNSFTKFGYILRSNIHSESRGWMPPREDEP
jgi:hypothetical protein